LAGLPPPTSLFLSAGWPDKTVFYRQYLIRIPSKDPVCSDTFLPLQMNVILLRVGVRVAAYAFVHRS
jgi:hypothetical protein